MKKKNLIHLVQAGIAAGLLFSPQARIFADNDQDKEAAEKFMKLVQETDGNITYHKMTQDELLLELNEEGAEIYQSLSPEGKALALQMADRSCNNTNACKGENACRTDKNKCAGQGSCKGTTKCAFSDKNLAVKVAAKKMAEKRQQALQGNQSADQAGKK